MKKSLIITFLTIVAIVTIAVTFKAFAKDLPEVEVTCSETCCGIGHRWEPSDNPDPKQRCEFGGFTWTTCNCVCDPNL